MAKLYSLIQEGTLRYQCSGYQELTVFLGSRSTFHLKNTKARFREKEDNCSCEQLRF